MDRYVANTGSISSTLTDPNNTSIRPHPNIVKFDETRLRETDPILLEKYLALNDTSRHAFRIAFEQMGSSFDYRQCE
jgi:hypothetical protein